MKRTVLSRRSRPRQLARLGAVLWLLGTLQFYVVHLLVERAWPTPYSWMHNNISDLGHKTCGVWGADARSICSPLHTLMNGAFVLQGIFLITGIVLLQSVWRRFATRTTAAFLLLAGIGWILAGLAPADIQEPVHILGALLIFFAGNLGLIVADQAVQHAEQSAIRTYSRTLGVVGLVATALFLGQIYLVFGMGGMERLAVVPLQLWTLLISIWVFRQSSVEPTTVVSEP